MNPENKTLSLLPSGKIYLRIKPTQRETGAEMVREHYIYTSVNGGPHIAFPNKIFHFSLSFPVLSLQTAPSCLSNDSSNHDFTDGMSWTLKKARSGKGCHVDGMVPGARMASPRPYGAACSGSTHGPSVHSTSSCGRKLSLSHAHLRQPHGARVLLVHTGVPLGAPPSEI